MIVIPVQPGTRLPTAPLRAAREMVSRFCRDDEMVLGAI